MAKTIMIANDLYDDLKKIKGERSFTETIKDALNGKRKTIGGLRKVMGTLPKEDMEYEKAMKELKPLYAKWTKKYV
jgi:predicted CopG family antitoxin